MTKNDYRTSPVSCFDALYGGLGKSKLQFLIKKRKKNFNCNFFLQLLVIKTQHPDPDSMNQDPQQGTDYMYAMCEVDSCI